MLQNEGFPMVIGEYFSPWLKKILSFTALKCFRMNDFQWLFGNTFTMVEENFEFYCSEMLQNEWFLMIVGEYFSPWLKKILSFTALKCFRMNDSQWLFGNTFTMVEENFEFCCSRMLQNEEWFQGHSSKRRAVLRVSRVFGVTYPSFRVFRVFRVG